MGARFGVSAPAGLKRTNSGSKKSPRRSGSEGSGPVTEERRRTPRSPQSPAAPAPAQTSSSNWAEPRAPSEAGTPRDAAAPATHDSVDEVSVVQGVGDDMSLLKVSGDSGVAAAQAATQAARMQLSSPVISPDGSPRSPMT